MSETRQRRQEDISGIRSLISDRPREGRGPLLCNDPKWKKYADHNRDIKNYAFCNSQSRRPPTASLGDFDRLPLEILQGLLMRLDLFTFTAFRLVNRRAADTVETIPQYKTLLTHTIHNIRHVLLIGMGRWTSCLSLYEQLYEDCCVHCGNFGDLLWIPTCRRICQPCFWGHERCDPVWKYKAFSLFGLDASMLRQLPHFTTRQPRPRGTSCSDEWEDFTLLWDYDTVAQLAVEIHGSIEVARENARQRVEEMRKRRRKEHDKIHQLLVDCGFGDGGYVSDVLPKGPSLEQRAIMKLMAVIRYPSMDRQTHQPQQSFYCRGCEKTPIRPYDKLRKHNVASFRKHLTEHEDMTRYGSTTSRLLRRT